MGHETRKRCWSEPPSCLSRYLDGRARPLRVRWVDNQTARWGSCTPGAGRSGVLRLQKSMPPWVVDYVLVHELAHLLVPQHGPQFWALVERYPCTERARGYLQGVDAAAGRNLPKDEDADLDDDVEDSP